MRRHRKNSPYLFRLLLAFLALAGIFSFAPAVWAQKTVLYNGNPIIVHVAQLAPTEIVFEGEEIGSVILGLPADAISIQNTVNTVFLQPLSENLAGDIYVITRDGKSRMLTLVPSLPDIRDRSIRVVNAVQDMTDRINKIRQEGITPAGLIRAMILGQDLDGVSVSETKQVIIDKPVKLTATTVCDAVFLRGYIVDMTGNEDFDLKTINFKGMLAGAIYKGRGYFVIGEN